ncbi:MAG TPA: 16S rRNA (adenine(1518)-N(6)/adenine(1519)-N(6))-dimethyltransferase RsmA, partial [Kiritimatiellia bacterium]
LRIMLDAARLEKSDVVLEVGPGLGTLTGPMVERTRRVIAIEKDSRLFQWLEKHLAQSSNLRMIHADALAIDLSSLLKEEGVTKVVSNLPYSVGSRILVELFSAATPPRRIQVTVQKEVADRLKAAPDTADYGLLSVWAQSLYDVALGHVISGGCFYPEPQVQSALVDLAWREKQIVGRDRWPVLMRLTKRAFEHRRKKLGTSLRGVALEAAGIDPNDRPENIAPAAWCRLAEVELP